MDRCRAGQALLLVFGFAFFLVLNWYGDVKRLCRLVGVAAIDMIRLPHETNTKLLAKHRAITLLRGLGKHLGSTCFLQLPGKLIGRQATQRRIAASRFE